MITINNYAAGWGISSKTKNLVIILVNRCSYLKCAALSKKAASHPSVRLEQYSLDKLQLL